MKLRFVFVFVAASPLLFWSCATSREDDIRIDPVPALSYSSEGAVPAAFAIIPPAFVLSELEEIKASAALDEGANVAEFLSDFFSRADSVFASLMINPKTDTLFCRIFAYGKFPARALRFILSSSRGWERRRSGDALWFESSSYMEGGTIRAAIPVSGVLLAEIDIVLPSEKAVAVSASAAGDEQFKLSMADFVSAVSLSPAAAPFAREFSGAGEMFFSAVDGALLGAVNVPFVFYVPDFNLFMRSVLPSVPAFPLAGASDVLKGFSLPISSIEFAIARSGGSSESPPSAHLTVCAAVSSPVFLRPASLVLRLIFPDERIFVENGLIKVEKEISAGSAALAILSLFSVS